MYSPVSALWDFALRNNGQRVCRADLHYDNNDTPVIVGLPVGDYSVTTDRTAQTRRSGSITIVSQELLDILRTDPGTSSLEPYGSEIKLYAGVRHTDGTEEVVPLGVFQIEDLAWEEPDPAMVFTLFDRSIVYQRLSFSWPYDVSGVGAKETIEILVGGHTPWVDLTISDDLVDVIAPGGTTYTGDFWSMIQKVAGSMGGEAYFDVEGNLLVVPVPALDAITQTSEANWTVDAGQQGVMLRANPSISRTDTRNRINVIGTASEGVQEPAYWAEDLDPTSPTYVYGPFGVSDEVIQRQDLTTVAQCKAVAEAILANSLGLSQTLTLSSLYNPALQEADVILVVFPDAREELHLVDKLSFTKDGKMEIATRSRVRQSLA